MENEQCGRVAAENKGTDLTSLPEFLGLGEGAAESLGAGSVFEELQLRMISEKIDILRWWGGRQGRK